MIIFRYLTREILLLLMIILTILSFILFTNKFLLILHQVTTGTLPVTLIWKILLLQTPYFLTFLFPLGLLLSILFVYSRLHLDHEMTALMASGLSFYRLVGMTMPSILGVVVVTSFSALWLNPKLLSMSNHLVDKTGTQVSLQLIQPGYFKPIGKSVVYMENISTDHNEAQKIFVAQPEINANGNGGQQWTILTADKGQQKTNTQTGQRFFEAINGNRYQGEVGAKEFYVSHFASYGIFMNAEALPANNEQEAVPTLTLLRPKPEEKLVYFAELQWRLASPLSALLLGILAIPLSQTNPRTTRRYLHLLPGLLVYIFYLNLLISARRWIVTGNFLSQLGLWWIHGLLILFILFVLLQKKIWVLPSFFSPIKKRLS